VTPRAQAAPAGVRRVLAHTLTNTGTAADAFALAAAEDVSRALCHPGPCPPSGPPHARERPACSHGGI